jgi:hypothetical protein
MSEKPVYVVSDTHLGAVPRDTERAFRGFLDHVAETRRAADQRRPVRLLVRVPLVILREHFRTVAGWPTWWTRG